jgi:hypothetical protein
MSKPELKLGVYQHYSGKRYLVIAEAKHSETLEPLVVYVSLYDNPESQAWVRPKTMFLETVVRDGKKQPRFKYLGSHLQSTK